MILLQLQRLQEFNYDNIVDPDIYTNKILLYNTRKAI
jgi:hypothetical protein